MDERPLWQKLVAALAGLVCIACIIIFWNRFSADFWPPDRSFVGPNILASVVSFIAMFIVTVLVYPPSRRASHRFVDAKIQSLKDHITHHHKRQDEHNEWVARHLRKLHLAHLDEDVEDHPHFKLKK